MCDESLFICKFVCVFFNPLKVHTHTQPFYGSVEIVWDNPGEPVPEETFTHFTHRGHQSSLSAFSIYYDTWHPPYSIHMLYSLFPQSLSKFSLVYLLAFKSKMVIITICFWSVFWMSCTLYIVSVEFFQLSPLVYCQWLSIVIFESVLTYYGTVWLRLHWKCH